MQRFEADALGRTIFGAMLEVQYGIQFNQMNEDFFGRVAKTVTLLTIAAGGVAAANFVYVLEPKLNGWLGLIVAILGAYQVAFQPAHTAAAHREAKRAFYALNSVVMSLSIADAYARIDAIRRDAQNGLRVFAWPAFNRAMLSQGQTNAIHELSGIEKVANFLA